MNKKIGFIIASGLIVITFTTMLYLLTWHETFQAKVYDIWKDSKTDETVLNVTFTQYKNFLWKRDRIISTMEIYRNINSSQVLLWALNNVHGMIKVKPHHYIFNDPISYWNITHSVS